MGEYDIPSASQQDFFGLKRPAEAITNSTSEIKVLQPEPGLL